MDKIACLWCYCSTPKRLGHGRFRWACALSGKTIDPMMHGCQYFKERIATAIPLKGETPDAQNEPGHSEA